MTTNPNPAAKPKVALITGITGQDGSYLAEFLLEKGAMFPVGGLILHSPFASVYRVVVNLGFTVSGDKFPNIDRMNEVE